MADVKRKATRKSVPATRVYNSETRLLQSEQSQNLVLATYIKLLVERKGEEVSVSEISEVSGISPRTVFRFFKDKEALHKATSDYITDYLKEAIRRLDATDLFEFIVQTFESFDRNEDLVIAYVVSPFGQQLRAVFRKNFEQLVIQKIRKQYTLKNDAKTTAKLAVIVAMINAKIWYDIRSTNKLSGTQIGQGVAWAVKLTLDDLR